MIRVTRSELFCFSFRKHMHHKVYDVLRNSFGTGHLYWSSTWVKTKTYKTKISFIVLKFAKRKVKKVEKVKKVTTVIEFYNHRFLLLPSDSLCELHGSLNSVLYSISSQLSYFFGLPNY